MKTSHLSLLCLLAIMLLFTECQPDDINSSVPDAEFKEMTAKANIPTSNIIGNGPDCETTNGSGCEPTVLCKYGLVVVLNSSGTATFKASRLDGGSFGCGNLTFTASKYGQEEAGCITFDCNDLGQIPVDVFVSDNFGHSVSCSTIVLVQGDCSGG